MNIGIDIRVLGSLVRTGIGEYTHELLQALFAAHPENQYFLFSNSARSATGILPQWTYPYVHTIHVRLPNKVFNASAFFLKRPQIDTLLAYRGRVPQLDCFFSPNLNFTPLSRAVRYVLTIHDLSFLFFPQFFTLKQRLWHRAVQPHCHVVRAERILVPSHNTKRDVVDYFGVKEEKVTVVYPGLSSAFLQESGSIEAIKQRYHLPPHFFLYLGTIEPRKNIGAIIEAYREVRKSMPAHELIIAGALGWKRERIMRLVEQTPGVRYIGYVPAEDKPLLYQAASVFVYPSLYEGFGFPVLEAFAAGTPVVTSNRSALIEVAGRAAYLVNPLNIHDIAEGMRVLSDSEKAQSYRSAGKERAKEFSWGRAAEIFFQCLS